MVSEIETLLTENRTEIDKLKEKLKDVITAEYDDIWLLRYVMSNKTAEEAEEPARFTIKWRQDHKEDLIKVKSGDKIPLIEKMQQFQVAGEHKFTKKGEPLMYIRIALSNTKALLDVVTTEEALYGMTMMRMRLIEYCDAETRKQGKIVKVVSILDFQHFNPTRGYDPRFSKVIGESSKLNEKISPQLQGSTIFVNVPSYIMWIFNVIKPLMSKRAVEKMIFCPGFTSGKSIEDCPFLKGYIDLDEVPSFLGGKCNCPGGCVGNVPNSQTKPTAGLTDDGLSKLVISARSKQDLEFPMVKGTVASFTFKSDNKSIEASVAFKSEHNSGGNDIEVLKKDFVDKSGDTVTGKFEALNDGVLVLTFNNNHSLIFSKSVCYKIDFDYPVTVLN